MSIFKLLCRLMVFVFYFISSFRDYHLNICLKEKVIVAQRIKNFHLLLIIFLIPYVIKNSFCFKKNLSYFGQFLELTYWFLCVFSTNHLGVNANMAWSHMKCQNNLIPIVKCYITIPPQVAAAFTLCLIHWQGIYTVLYTSYTYSPKPSQVRKARAYL